MKKLILLAALCWAGYSTNAQTVVEFQGHTYVDAGRMNLINAWITAAGMGGHLVFVDSEAEYEFIDKTFVKRGTGWWWTGMQECGGAWYNNGAINPYMPRITTTHWLNTIPNYPLGYLSRMVMGKFQISNRSMKYVTKFYQFSDDFCIYSNGGNLESSTLVEIDHLLTCPGVAADVTQ